MKKIIDFKGIEKYFCFMCNHNHYKYRKGKKTDIFQKHQEFAFELSTTEQFTKSFQRNWIRHQNSDNYKKHLIKNDLNDK